MARLELIGVTCFALVCGFAARGWAQAPSLAAVAQQEKARRAALEESSRVYTNEDLREGPGLTIGSIPTQIARGATPPTDEVPVPRDDPQHALSPDTTERGEEYWRRRITSARENRRRAELIAAALQNRVDGLWAEFTGRDDPLQRRQIEQSRTDALVELERTTAEIVRLDREIREIQAEARRSSVPPGWLR